MELLISTLFHPQKDSLQQCGSRQPLCAHLSGRLTFASLDCGTRPKVSTNTLHNLSSKYSIVICLLIGKSPAKLASRVLFQRPAHYLPETILRQHVTERVFPDGRLRRKAPNTDQVAFQAKCNELRLLAAGAERANPVSFAIETSWNDTLKR